MSLDIVICPLESKISICELNAKMLFPVVLLKQQCLFMKTEGVVYMIYTVFCCECYVSTKHIFFTKDSREPGYNP